MNIVKMTGVLLLSGMLFAACSKDKEASSGDHEINVRLTDAPFDAEEVNVDIRKVQVHFTDDNSGWYDLDTHDGIYNLLALQNGVNVLIATGVYPHTRLTEIRLILGDNNSIKIAGVLLPLTIPSGSESGLKIKVNKDLSGPLETILIDFDAGLSIIKTGNGSFKLLPVIKLK